MTVEPEPRIIILNDADIQKVHHAFGTNGILLDLDLALAPKVEWRHVIATFPGYPDCVRFGVAASRPDIDSFLLTAVDRRFAPYYRSIAAYFSGDADAVFAMVHPDAMAAFAALAKAHGGAVALDRSEAELEAAHLPPAYECAYNHTTLQALREDRSFTYLQMVYPQGFDIGLIDAQLRRFGDELFMHHEFAKQFGEYRVFALPLVRWTTKARIYEIIRSFEADGCQIFDPHVYTIEDGGMKEIDEKQIAFKRIADPQGLMNPGKTLGWPA
jgi:FAD/FMN-containing dehydrogenase